MSQEFVPCTTVYLPSEMQVEAAKVAVTENPANRPSNSLSAASGIILPPEHLAVLTSRYWGPGGVNLTVGFMEQTPTDLKNRIVAHANAWGQYGNIKFVLSNTDPQVRITRAASGYWSYLGSDILSIPKDQPTMCLQGFTMNTSEAEYRRVVRHEFGHTLGMPHEHMRRQIVDRLDHQKTIAYFRQTQGWSAAMVQQQVLTPLAENSIMGTNDADENSIMTYSLPAQITKDGRPIIGGKDIEEQDQLFVAKIYPKVTTPVEPPVPPTISGDVSISHAISLADKKITILAKAPSGWSVETKKAAALTEDEECDNVQEKRTGRGTRSRSAAVQRPRRRTRRNAQR